MVPKAATMPISILIKAVELNRFRKEQALLNLAVFISDYAHITFSCMETKRISKILIFAEFTGSLFLHNYAET